MPCTDPREVTCLADAFDLSTTEIRQWELELIWSATALRVVEVSHHARLAAKDDSVPISVLWRVIRNGVPRSKDIGLDVRRQIGINFEGKKGGRGWIRVKVTWSDGYTIATVHAL
jgi:hypothetical protein